MVTCPFTMVIHRQQSFHVVTVALLSKLDVDEHIDVENQLDELDLTSAESKATYAQIKEYVQNKFELKVLTLYIAQIKKKCGIKLREHYNKSKKRSKFCVVLLIKNYKQRDFVMDTLLVPILFAAPLFYSFDNAPFILKCISRLNPLTYQVDAMRVIAFGIPDFTTICIVLVFTVVAYLFAIFCLGNSDFKNDEH